MDWFKGKSTGNHGFSHQIWCFPVNFPLNQSIETKEGMSPAFLGRAFYKANRFGIRFMA
jgi:hypothetical protein